jgi:hypothetical protein
VSLHCGPPEREANCGRSTRSQGESFHGPRNPLENATLSGSLLKASAGSTTLNVVTFRPSGS